MEHFQAKQLQDISRYGTTKGQEKERK